MVHWGGCVVGVEAASGAVNAGRIACIVRIRSCGDANDGKHWKLRRSIKLMEAELTCITNDTSTDCVSPSGIMVTFITAVSAEDWD